jgi:hypothetical protein
MARRARSASCRQGIYEIVFILVEHKHRARRAAHDILRGAPLEQVLQAGVAVSRRDDEVRPNFARHFEDGFEDEALPDGGLHGQSRRDHFIELLFNDRQLLLLEICEIRSILKVSRSLQDVQERDFRAELLRQRHGILQRLQRHLGEIQWHKDILQMNRGRIWSAGVAPDWRAR